MTERDLKPCPFPACNMQDFGLSNAKLVFVSGDDADRFNAVQCDGCGLTGPLGEGEQEAAEYWNDLPRESLLADARRERDAARGRIAELEKCVRAFRLYCDTPWVKAQEEWYALMGPDNLPSDSMGNEHYMKLKKLFRAAELSGAPAPGAAPAHEETPNRSVTVAGTTRADSHKPGEHATHRDGVHGRSGTSAPRAENDRREK